MITRTAPALPSLLLSIGLATGVAFAQPKPPPDSPKVDLRDAVALSQLRESAVQSLIAATSSPAAEERANACEALLLAPGRLEPLLPKLLRDENLGVRAVAAMAVGKGKFTKWLEQVRPMQFDPSPMVRCAAIFAVVRCDPAATPSTLARLLNSEEPRVKAQAAYILGELGNPSAVGMIREAAVRGNPRVDPAELRLAQLQMAEALVKLGDSDAIHEIRAALYPTRPEDLEAAALAAQILGQVRDRGASTQLVYLTAEWDPQKKKMPAEVRLAAAAALARIGNSRGSFIADEFVGDAIPALRAQAAFVYGETGQSENLLRLAELRTSDPAPLVRIAADYAVLKIIDGRRDGQR